MPESRTPLEPGIFQYACACVCVSAFITYRLIQVHLCVSTHYLCARICMYVCTYVLLHLWLCMKYKHALSMHACMHAYMHYPCIHICAHIHTYTHTYTYTYTYTITARYWIALQPDGRSLAALHRRRAAGFAACGLRGSLRLAPRPQDGWTVQVPRIDIGFDVWWPQLKPMSRIHLYWDSHQ